MQRFFELIANKSKPSLYTLNTLSEYVGCSSWEDFKNKHKEDLLISKSEKVSVDEFGLTLFNLCLKNHNFNTVLEYLNLLPEKELDYFTQRKIVTSLGKVIRKDKKAQTVLLPELAKSYTGRKYFYEYFVDIDCINQYYSNAISNHYAKHISVFNDKKAVDDLVFSKSIEFISFLKVGKNKDAIKTANSLFKKVSPYSEFVIFNHPYPYARLQSLFIISEALKKSLTQTKIDQLINRVNLVCNKIHQDNASFVVAQVIMSLNYIGRYSDVLSLYKDYKSLIDNSYRVNVVHQIIKSCVKNSLHQLNTTAVFDFTNIVIDDYIIESSLSCNNPFPLI